MPFYFNPFTSRLDYSKQSGSGSSVESVICRDQICHPDVVVDDLLYYNVLGPPLAIGETIVIGGFVIGQNTILETVTANTNAQMLYGIVGICINKTDPTTCDVLLMGCYGTFSSFNLGDSVFVSTSGSLTNVAPVTGIKQHLGFIGDGKSLVFKPTKPEGENTVADQAEKIVIDNLNCLSSVALRDLVILDSISNTANEVLSNSPSEIPNGVLGVVIRKPTTTTCDVLVVGTVDGFTGLTAGLPVFVQPNGSIGHTPPSIDIVQQIGFAASSSKLLLVPQLPILKV